MARPSNNYIAKLEHEHSAMLHALRRLTESMESLNEEDFDIPEEVSWALEDSRNLIDAIDNSIDDDESQGIY